MLHRESFELGQREGLSGSLTPKERRLLSTEQDKLPQQELIDLQWQLEALWALLWAGNLAADLPIHEHVPDTMAQLVPNLQLGEGGSKLRDVMRIRAHDELWSALDLYYIAHWYAVDARVNRQDPDPIDEGVIFERRRSLEWVLDPRFNWDKPVMNT